MRTYLTLAGRLARATVTRPAAPYKLTYAVTYGCNYRCRMCEIWQRTPAGELTLDEIDRFFAKNPHFSWIDFTGGEPWLRRDFADIVRSGITRCPSLLLAHFATNGWLTDQIVAGVERILEARPPKLMVTVSLDGDRATNDRVRGIPGGWDRQVETYARLSRMRGVEAVLGMTLSVDNVDGYPAALDAVRERCPWVTPRDFHVNLVHHSSHYYGNHANDTLRACGDEALGAAMIRFHRARGVPRSVVDLLEHEYLRRVPAYLSEGRTPMRCHALRSTCFLNPSGTVYPCVTFDRPLGNVRDHDFDLAPLWHSDIVTSTQRGIWAGDCPQCWTPCEAYPSILGNVLGLRPSGRATSSPRAGGHATTSPG